MYPDALSLIAFAAAFLVVLHLTIRRAVYGACALIATAPFAYYQVTGPTMMTLGKCTIAAVIIGLFARAQPFSAVRDRLALRFIVAGLALVAATAITLAEARYVEPVLRETLKAVEYVIVFAVTYSAYRADPDQGLVQRTLAIVTLAVCIPALAQELTGAPSVLLMNGHPTPRIAGPLEGPNQLAGYLEVSLALLFAFVLTAPNRLLLTTLFVAAMTDVLTFSRGGLLGAIAGVMCVAIVIQARARRALVTTLGGAFAGGIIAAVWGVLAHTIGLARFWDLSPSAYAGGVGTRPQLWRAALQLWHAHPLLGIGAGNFEFEAAGTGLTKAHTHANNLYLQSLVEGGIPLFAANVWVILLGVASFARRTLATPLTAGALGATAALAAHQTVDLVVFYPKVGSWWWIVLALGAASMNTVSSLYHGEVSNDG